MKKTKFHYAQIINLENEKISEEMNDLVSTVFLNLINNSSSVYETCTLVGTKFPSDLSRISCLNNEEETLYLFILKNSKELSKNDIEELDSYYNVDSKQDWIRLTLDMDLLSSAIPDLNPEFSIWWNVTSVPLELKNIWNSFFPIGH